MQLVMQINHAQAASASDEHVIVSGHITFSSLHDFLFDFCIPNSTNTWEAIYDMPELPADLLQEMIDNPWETESDSFFFVGETMIMHNKVRPSANRGAAAPGGQGVFWCCSASAGGVARAAGGKGGDGTRVECGGQRGCEGLVQSRRAAGAALRWW